MLTKSNRKVHVAVTRLIPSAGLRMLEERFEITQWRSDAPPPRDELIKLLSDADGAMTLLSDTVDAAVLDTCPRLRIIANMAVGYENIDLGAAAARGVWVTNTPDVLTDAAADIAMTLILCVARRIIEADRFMRAGKYRHWDPLLLRGMGLTGKTLGVVGMGRIGRAVSHRARAFGMKIIYADPSTEETEVADLEARRVDFDTLLSESDVVSLHCPYAPELHHMIDAAALAKMKKTAFFINTARGKLMDERALYEALRDGGIAGAGLDVYEHEPEFVEDLLRLDNIVMLPHIGSATRETRDAMAELAARNIIAVFEGREPITPVNHPKETKR